MNRALLALTLLATVALTACHVGPDYDPPELVVPDTWRTATNDAITNEDVIWWDRFGDEALTALVNEALQNNLDVQVAAARVEEFAARIGIAESAAYPQITYDASASQNQTSREVNPNANRVSGLFNANLNVGWELDLWGRIARSAEAARADYLQSTENRRAVILSLVSGVATSYVGLRSLDRQLEIARARLGTSAESLRLFELQQSAGVISELEVAQVRSEYERTAATIPVLQRDIATLENSLSVLLGRPPGPIDRGTAIEQLTPPGIPAGLPADLLLQRPDILAAEQAVIATNARIGEAIGDYYPRISLTGMLGLASDDLSNIAKASAGTYSLAAGLTGPIFTAGFIEGQVNAARAADKQAVSTYRQTLLTAFREVEDALVIRSTTIDQAAAQARQLDALNTYNRLARLRYDNGYVGYLEVLDADRDRFDAQLQQVQLMAERLGSDIAVYKAMGGGWVDTATQAADDAQRARNDDTQNPEQPPEPPAEEQPDATE